MMQVYLLMVYFNLFINVPTCTPQLMYRFFSSFSHGMHITKETENYMHKFWYDDIFFKLIIDYIVNTGIGKTN